MAYGLGFRIESLFFLLIVWLTVKGLGFRVWDFLAHFQWT